MKTFKHFITEHKVSLGDSQLLDAHMKYHAAGIPLPDRDDLYRKYTSEHAPIRYPKEDGGFVEHNLGDKSITHYTDNELAHRTDGPAITRELGQPSKIWALHGKTVGEHREFKYGDGTYIHSFFIHKQHKDRAGGWSSHEVNTLGEFNKHLADHGFPPHKVPNENI